MSRFAGEAVQVSGGGGGEGDIVTHRRNMVAFFHNFSPLSEKDTRIFRVWLQIIVYPQARTAGNGLIEQWKCDK